MAPSDTVMRIEPVRRMGLRPTRSTSTIATIVTSTFVTDVMTLIRREFCSVKPTARHSVVE